MSQESPSHAQQQAFQMLGLVVAKLVRAPLWLILSAVLARVLEPSGLGTWSMILAVATLLNQILLHWTQSITQRFGRAELLEHGQLTQTWASRWPFLAVGGCVAIILLLSQPFSWLTRFYGLHFQHIYFILLMLLALWLMAEAQNLQQVSTRFSRLAWSPVVSDAALLLVLVVLYGLQQTHVGSFAFSTTISYLLACMLLSWLLWMVLELRHTKIRWLKPDPIQLKQALLFSVPLIPGFIVGYGAEWCDYFLIRYYYSEHEVGLFHPAYQYMLLLVGLPSAVAAVLLPKILGHVDKDGGQGIRQLVQNTAPQLIFLWLFASFGIVAIIPAIFALLLGAKFLISQDVLTILLIAVPGAISAHLYSIACFAQGRLIVSTVGVYGVKVVINVLVSFLLLPAWGVTGSAMGSAVGYIVLQWLFLWDQHRQLNVKVNASVIGLLLAHIYGVSMACVPDLAPRILLSLIFAILTILIVRRLGIFAQEQIVMLIPQRLSPVASFLSKLLVSGDQKQ